MYLAANAVPLLIRSDITEGSKFPSSIPSIIPITTGLIPEESANEDWAIKVAATAVAAGNNIPK